MIICQSQQLTVHNLTTRPTVINYPTNDQPTNMSSCEAPYISGMSHHARHPDLILHYFFFEGLITIVFSLSYFLTNYHEHTAYVSHLVKVCAYMCPHDNLKTITDICFLLGNWTDWRKILDNFASRSYVSIICQRVQEVYNFLPWVTDSETPSQVTSFSSFKVSTEHSWFYWRNSFYIQL